MNKLKKVFLDVATDPATFIALGSVFMAAAMGAKEGAIANALATLLVASLKAHESWTGQEKGKPFGALALVNFATAASIVYNLTKNQEPDPDIVQKLSLTGAYCLWGVRSTLLSVQERWNKKPKAVKDDPQFYQGLGALATTRGEWIPMVFALLGVARTMVKKPNSDEGNEPKEPSKLMKHFTATRAYAVQYAASALLVAWGLTEKAVNNTPADVQEQIVNTPSWKMAVAFAMWSWAFSRFQSDDLQQNTKLSRSDAQEEAPRLP